MTKIQNPKATQVKFPSELRFDPMGRDWVVIATGRALRSETFKKEKSASRRKEKIPSKKNCPFCHIETQKPPTLIFSQGKRINSLKIPKDWTTIVVPNKYPAFQPAKKLNERQVGPYKVMDAVGYHEVVITKDHQKSLAQLSIPEVKEVIDVYHQTYLELMKKQMIKYIFIFHNHGREAGASIFHPHSQIIASAVIDPDLEKALRAAKRYFNSYKKCSYCVGNEWERKNKERIVFENKNFLAICPFASKIVFEVIITPKKHLAHFEKITDEEKNDLAEIFQKVLRKLYLGLNNPAYNFYLHTAPCNGKKYDHYHWHWTILPKTSTPAGFEFGAKMEISTIEPEKAAKYLREQI